MHGKRAVATPAGMDTIGNSTANFFTTVNNSIRNPLMVSIDFPDEGVGLECSIRKLFGTIRMI